MMTDSELLRLAEEGRVVDVPTCGFLIDDEPADTEATLRLGWLLTNLLLRRTGSDDKSQSPVAPTLAGVALMGARS